MPLNFLNGLFYNQFLWLLTATANALRQFKFDQFAAKCQIQNLISIKFILSKSCKKNCCFLFGSCIWWHLMINIFGNFLNVSVNKF